MNSELNSYLKSLNLSSRITFLTGAGISAESGIPTFRGPEGYWTIGSENYRPEELATHQMFMQQPREIWSWYLYRLGKCEHADPNSGHFEIAKIQKKYPNTYLISQNVDGLHERAHSPDDRSFYIHGNIRHTRCSNDCSLELFVCPKEESLYNKDALLSDDDWEKFKCPKCGALLRPHVLWFDEMYNEHFYRFDSSIRVASETDILFVIGTSGATTLPNYVVQNAMQAGAVVVEVNPNETQFSGMIDSYEKGFLMRETSVGILKEILGK